MPTPLILASSSKIRADLLNNANIRFETAAAKLDETMIMAALQADGASPRDIADTLAELKAQKISSRYPGSLVIGCDQVLAFGQKIFSKPDTPEAAIAQLSELKGQKHQLLSAAVIYLDGQPQWRHVGIVRLVMRDLSDAYISDYVARNWDSIQLAVGSYKLEEEGVRLFTRIEGDYFNVLGLPLLELLSYLALRGDIDT